MPSELSTQPLPTVWNGHEGRWGVWQGLPG